MKKQSLFLFILLIIGVQFQSCSSYYKTSKLLQAGEVVNSDYLVEIPFKYYKDLILINIKINDNNYNFFIDTGAELNVIGQHIAGEIDYKAITSSKISGTSKEKREAQFISLPKISITDIEFLNTGAIIMDISHFDKYVGCEKIDGIIGNNLLRKATWQIDYKNRTIKITNTIEKLILSENTSEIVMNSGNSRNVDLNVTIDGVSSKFTFDTGYTGKIKSDKSFFDLLIANNSNLEYITETGITSTTIHGVVYGTTYSALVNNIDIEGVTLNDQIVSFKEVSSSLIGNQFFKNFILTIDWKNDILYLDPDNKFVSDTLVAHELTISPNYVTNKIEVIRSQDDYQPKEKVNIGAEVLLINNIDVSYFTSLQLCDFWSQEKEKIKNQEIIELVLLDNGIRKNVKLTRKIILPK